jgi:GcrA cell cycle regulator
MSWTEPRVEMLRTLWGDGLTASQIAAELGDCTRSAVIGKICRLGLTGRQLAQRAAKARARAGMPRSKPRADAWIPRKIEQTRVRRVVQMGGHFQVLKQIDYQLPDEMPAEAIPLKQRKTLVELANHHCRWPYGHPTEPGFFFCGDPSADLLGNRPYCRIHSMQAMGMQAE